SATALVASLAAEPTALVASVAADATALVASATASSVLSSPPHALRARARAANPDAAAIARRRVRLFCVIDTPRAGVPQRLPEQRPWSGPNAPDCVGSVIIVMRMSSLSRRRSPARWPHGSVHHTIP